MSSFTSHELILACGQPGCPACRVEQRALERYLSNQLYENVNSTALRDRLRASRGFCKEHAWLGVDKHLGDPLGYAIIYHDVINNVLRQLEDALAQPAQGLAALQRRISEKISGLVGTVIHAITPRKACPVCQEKEAITRMILTALIKELDDAPLMDALRASDGLCFLHLRLSLEAAQQNSAGFDSLLAIHRGKLESLRDELAELIRKNDHRYIHDVLGREGDAWRRAITIVAGSHHEED
ncbi:MAG TPA: DUF6062 family protein [Anaerolineales bacterium]|jgi:hypothetical protein